ncbi:MAG: methionyl-tRNA formyltransferase [Candidatus Moranbacteria bacterium RBG_13_45_13]|nr:MAG: methionyl-tRNA formyltransferase [Candidatus Moranbacteria bacterium RBG_13_45_13]
MNKIDPKIIFFGTPEFASGILESLIGAGYKISAVFTQPDKKVGRDRKIVFSPVKKLALRREIKVFQPESLREIRIIRDIGKIGANLFIIAAYGKILPKEILDIPEFGAINIHASLLPKYRGASPVQCAILEGEKETGITLMLMNEKMDEGDVLVQEKMEIGENETAQILLEGLEKLGAKMMVGFIPDWTSGKVNPRPQNHSQATYCQIIRRQDGKINWNFSAAEIHRKWRAYQPWPGIFSIIEIPAKDGKNQPKRIKLSEVEIIPRSETGEDFGKIIKYNQNVAVQAKQGLIVLKKVQLEGKNEMDMADFVRGYPDFVGSKLE